MVNKRINRSAFIAALVEHADDLANHDYISFVGEFFGDGPEWEGVVRKSIKQKLAHKDLEARLDEAKQTILDLKKTIDSKKNDGADYLAMAQAATRARKSQMAAMDTLRAEIVALKAENAVLRARPSGDGTVVLIPVE